MRKGTLTAEVAEHELYPLFYDSVFNRLYTSRFKKFCTNTFETYKKHPEKLLGEAQIVAGFLDKVNIDVLVKEANKIYRDKKKWEGMYREAWISSIRKVIASWDSITFPTNSYKNDMLLRLIDHRNQIIGEYDVPQEKEIPSFEELVENFPDEGSSNLPKVA